MTTDLVHVDRMALLRFYDDSPRELNAKHATAINAVAGEELGLALLIDCMRRRGLSAEILDAPCTTGGKRGHRLDGWIRTAAALYQVEVKNWSSLSLGGKRFPLDATAVDAAAHRKRLWSEYWDGSDFRDLPARKVLEPMKPPVKGLPVEPLIAFWVGLHPEGLAEPWFRYPLKHKEFDAVNVFSMSTYLRSLSCASLELPLPKTLARLAILDEFFRQ